MARAPFGKSFGKIRAGDDKGSGRQRVG